jgi:hypothetical protein
MKIDKALKEAKDLFESFHSAGLSKNRAEEIEIVMKVVELIYRFDKNYPFYKNICNIKDKIFDKKATDKDFSDATMLLFRFVDYLKAIADDCKAN